MRILFSLLLLALLSGCSDSGDGRAMGTLERERIVITAPATQTITAVAVEEGQPVKNGDILLTFDAVQARANLNALQAQLAQAEAYLSQLQHGPRKETIAAASAQVHGAEASLNEAGISLRRAKQLHQKNLNAQADVDSAQAAYDSAVAAVQQAQAQLDELQAGTRDEEIAQAMAAADSLKAQVLSAEKTLSDLTLTAPADAVVDALPWHAGDRVTAGTTAITLLAANEPYARVYLPANRLAGLTAGSEVSVKIDGLDQALTGTLTRIRPQPAFTPYFALNERDRSALMYLSDVQFSGDALKTLGSVPTGRTLEVLLP